MGLFNRSSKSDVPLNGDEWSTNGASPRREATPEPTEAERAPVPTPEPEAPVEEISERDEAPTLGAEDPQSDPEPEPDPQPEPDPEPEPVAATTPAPVEAKPMPPVNRSEPEDGDDQRMSAEQALAPVRRPGMSRPPGAHIGDESERRAKIISFANQKGGVAKTTTTLNLAVAFKESGHDVLAIDLDPQGNLTMSQGIDPDKVERSMYDVLVDHIPIRDAIHAARDRHRRRVDRPRRRGDRDEHADRPRALAREGPVGRRSTTTTSSASTPRRASGCSPSTRSRPRTR